MNLPVGFFRGGCDCLYLNIGLPDKDGKNQVIQLRNCQAHEWNSPLEFRITEYDGVKEPSPIENERALELVNHLSLLISCGEKWLTLHGSLKHTDLLIKKATSST